MSTSIPYLNEVWNVTTGCGDDMVSLGCTNCYARRMFGRNLWKCPVCNDGMTFTLQTCSRCHGTGHQDFTPTFHASRLDQPLHWRKPRRIGVSFMGDLFHEAIADEQIAGVWARMYQAHRHTFMVLTKRPARMCAITSAGWFVEMVQQATEAMLDYEDELYVQDGPWPPRNVHLGVTVCNQAEADRNIPLLLDTPAAVRWVSIEPGVTP